MTTTHTATPWTVVKWREQTGSNGITISGDGKAVANMVMQLDDSEMDNARHIVHCVNTHDALVEALALMVAIADGVMQRKAAGDALGQFMAQAVECRKAIAKANGVTA